MRKGDTEAAPRLGSPMISRTVVATLAGEVVGRYRIHLLEPAESGRRTPPQDADFIAEAQRRLLLQGASRDDLERAVFAVVEG